jgi:hypothetical protein
LVAPALVAENEALTRKLDHFDFFLLPGLETH